MKTYEITFITKEDLKEKPLKTTLDALGGKILSISGIGEKNFTYPIKKETKGFYTTVSFEIEPSKLLELNKKLGLQEDILRYLIIIGKPAKEVKEIPVPKASEAQSSMPKGEALREGGKEKSPVAKAMGDKEKITKPIKKVEKEVVEPVIKPVKKVSPKVSEIEKETETEEDRLKALDKKLDELLKE